ncbi:MAG: hypothetical protein MMC23_003935 [Stictis urceolatum]|nr:hypothetical protein [Stictis urceolata]
MNRYAAQIAASAAVLLQAIANAQSSCSNSIAPTKSIQPSVASGYEYAVVATGLTSPRSVVFDSSGNLLVLEAGKGLSSHVIQDDGGTCVSIKSSKNMISDRDLTHGLALSPDGRTVYVSTSDKVYSYSYNPDQSTVGDDQKTLITGMEGSDHTTRTLLIPRSVDGQIVVARGSTENVDPQASDKSSGVSTVKTFNLTNVPNDGYEHNSSGTLLGWGLRNEVGIVEHPNSGAIWGVENSVDQLERNGKDIHTDNPGEELNFLGYLNGTKAPEQGSNFGYPRCLTAWMPSEMPDSGNISVGTPFADQASSDASCGNTTAPRLTWQAHTAPLDIKFNNSGSDAWVSFHGSWDRQDPVGYAVAMVAFDNQTGMPMAEADSSDSAKTVFANQDNSKCPDNCFRPVGMAFDGMGRMFVASDASGEIYAIRRAEGANATAPSGGSGGGGAGGGGQGNTGAGLGMAGMRVVVGVCAAWSAWFLL